jgi:hypothetical protein
VQPGALRQRNKKTESQIKRALELTTNMKAGKYPIARKRKQPASDYPYQEVLLLAFLCKHKTAVQHILRCDQPVF